jgi:dolichol-phosphate mannosyltransferase
MSMVIGNGVIANRFIDYSLQESYLIFAGCVNDSAIQDERLIEEEEQKVKDALLKYTAKCFVYFSTCSIQDPTVAHTSYVQHKARMEELVRKSSKDFLIFRLPQLMALSDAKSSLVNYLVDAISSLNNFKIWKNACKNIIDIDDVHEIVGEILRRKNALNRIINIASVHQTPVLSLVNDIEGFLARTGNYELVDKGTSYEIDIAEIRPILQHLNIDFGESYIPNSLVKYYGHLKQAPKLLSVIVPTYNEEHGIEEFYRRTKNVLSRISPRFDHEFIFVNDFSADNTYSKLRSIAAADSTVKIVNFSRNFGNQIGITAGIDFSSGNIAIIIDDDLQDPPEVIINLIAKWDKGYKVVYGVRPNRKGVNPFFKLAAKFYYRIIGVLSDTKIPNDTGDFRLIDRVVIETLKKMKEENRYYRGMVAWVGFPQIGVEYERDKRFAGVSTFSFNKYVKFAINGLTSFTEKPLYFSSLAGLLITISSFFLALFLIISRILDPAVSIRGWTSIIVVVLFFGGIQLLSIGVLGIYIGKIYREIKGRPLYIVEETINIERKKDAI